MSSVPQRRVLSGGAALVSRGMILILSGFLIGMAVRNTVTPAMETSVYLAGLAGLVSWMGLTCLAARRETRFSRLVERFEAERLAHRIDRHIPRGPHLRPRRRPLPAGDHQYVTVVRRSRGLSPNPRPG